MAMNRFVRLTVVETDSIIQCLKTLMAESGLGNSERRRIGLAVEKLAKAKTRRNGKTIKLPKNDVVLTLRAFALVGEFAELYERYFA